MPDKEKILMTLHGVWPIPITMKFDPIDLGEGVSIVCIEPEAEPSVQEVKEMKFNIYGKGASTMRLSQRNGPLNKLPRVALLFELQEKDEDGSYTFMPHYYAGNAMRPKTILRLFQTGEFISSLIISEFGYDISTPVSDSPDFLSYEIESNTIEPLKKFYKYMLEKMNQADKNFAGRKNSDTFKDLRLRLNNAIQFLDKSYFDEFSFGRHVGRYKLDTPRNDNYLRHIFCWLGIESLICYGKDDKMLQLKTHMKHFLGGYSQQIIDDVIHTHYDRRSGYIHADPKKMNSILNKDLEMIRDILKQLIMIYIFICSDDDELVEIGKKGKDINPVKALTKMDLTKYFSQMKDDSGADFSSYIFWDK